MTDGTSKRFRRFLLVFARLAVFVYVFQISSIDHHTDPNSITGMENSALHASHCHAAQASCADATGLTSSLTEINLVPVAPAGHLSNVLATLHQPIEAPILAPTEPPRAG